LLAHRRWFSPGTPASSTTKTGRHDIAEILPKVALNTKKQSINHEKIIKKKPEYPERTTDDEQATCKLYHLRLRVEGTLFVIYKTGRNNLFKFGYKSQT
jgi:hypothetical protein